jgi:hypothetical protein
MSRGDRKQYSISKSNKIAPPHNRPREFLDKDDVLLRELLGTNTLQRVDGSSTRAGETVLKRNFETSPLRFEYEALLKEYETVQAEIRSRSEKMQEITSFAIAVIAGLAALTQLFADNSNSIFTIQYFKPILPIISLLLSAFSLMTLEHDALRAHLQRYVDEILRPRMREILQETGNARLDIWDWSRMRVKWQYRSDFAVVFDFMLSSSKYAMTVIPNIFLILYYFYSIEKPLWYISPLEEPLFYLSLGGLFVVFLAAVYTAVVFARLESAP